MSTSKHFLPARPDHNVFPKHPAPTNKRLRWGFDPDLFFDTDGRTYLTTTLGSQFADPDSGYFAIWISEIDIKTGNALSEARLFHVSDLPLNTPRLAEGSHLFKKEGWYYLLTAEAGTEAGHRAMISRARSLNGPWEANPQNPILYNGMWSLIIFIIHCKLNKRPQGTICQIRF